VPYAARLALALDNVYNIGMIATARTTVLLASEQGTPKFVNSAAYAQSVLDGRDGRLSITFCVYDRKPLHRALANIVGHFRSTEADFLLYVSPEIRWHPSTIERAVKVSAKGAVVYVDLDTVEADLRANEASPVSAAGNTRSTVHWSVERVPRGFTLIHRGTIETLCERNPDLAFDDKASKLQAWDLFGPMERDGKLYGEDFAFCLRCRDAGLTILRMA
jgi:hypothetical protein